MKKTNIILMILISSIFLIPTVLALNTNVDTLPNKPLIYWFTVTLPEKIDLSFTFDSHEKLMKNTLLAEKRLAEIQELNQLTIPISKNTIKKYNSQLEKVEKAINKGVIDSESERQGIGNILDRIKEKEKQIPSDVVPLPIVIGKDSCGGISGKTCQNGYICNYDIRYNQLGQCVKGKAEGIKDTINCPMIYDPVCGEDGSTYPSECVATQRGISILKKGQCEETVKDGCKEICMYTGTISEGMYDSCSRKLIALKQCDFSNEKPIINPSPEPPLETCNSDKVCQDIYRSCYFKCLNGKCGEIQTFVALPNYPNCENTKPTPIPSPEPIPLPPIIRDRCSNDKTCVDTLRNCNAVCFKKQCILVNSFRQRGTYPNCDSYGIL